MPVLSAIPSGFIFFLSVNLSLGRFYLIVVYSRWLDSWLFECLFGISVEMYIGPNVYLFVHILRDYL